MAETIWTAASGDWNDAANWSAGVPGAGDDAVFPDSTGFGTITGDGSARSVTLSPGAAAQFTGHHDLGTLRDEGYLLLAATAGLTFTGATLSGQAGGPGNGVLAVRDGATLGPGTIVLDGGALEGTLGAIANPVVLASMGTISAVATLLGRISGPGTLVAGEAPFYPGGGLVLANPGDDYAGGTAVEGGQLVLAATGAAGTGPLLVAGDLFLDPGVATGPIVAASVHTDGSGTRLADARAAAADASPVIFASHGTLVYLNGSGAATVVGSVGAGVMPGSVLADFGTLSVSGGAGRVTVFGGDSRGTVFGGLAGHNVIVAGAQADGYTPGAYRNDPWTSPQGVTVEAPGTVTIGGGGDGDLLVVTGRQDNVIAAAGGNETLTGSGASGSNVFFGGTGADLVVAGAGRDLVVANGGAMTVSGGSGLVSVLAGGGQDLVVGGAGGAYVEAGAGEAGVFTGGGAVLVAFVAGQSGGSVTVEGFRPGTDHLAARGYAATPVVSAAGGGTVVAFADGGRAVLPGVAALPPGSFV